MKPNIAANNQSNCDFDRYHKYYRIRIRDHLIRDQTRKNNRMEKQQ